MRINGPELWLNAWPWPGVDAHKHRRGRLGVVSGPMRRTGAARLAARAGLRVGAGVVTVLSPPDAMMVNANHLEAIMLKSTPTPDAIVEAAADMQAVVIGPAAGIGEGTRGAIRQLLAVRPELVIDADGLTSFEDDPAELFSRLRPHAVLTPHEGEFERLWPGLLAKGREQAVTEAAATAGCVVLLKGPETLIADPSGELVSNPNGSPWLATAGTGDVLAGLIGGLLAQGLPAFTAACMAVWVHAEAAGRFGPGLIAEDLPDRIPVVLGELYAAR